MIPLHDNQPTQRFSYFTVLLILANVAVFVFWQLGVGLEQSVRTAALVPAELTGDNIRGALPDIFTSMFMHGGWMHLIGNMWFLWLFGNNIEDVTGHIRYVLFYLLCGVAAAVGQALWEPGSTIPMVGASGAVSGVLGAYLLIHPKAVVRTLIPLGVFIRIVNVPAWIFLLLWIGFQIVSQMAAGRAMPGQGGVAYMAHIGGFSAGMALIYLFKKSGPILQAGRRPSW